MTDKTTGFGGLEDHTFQEVFDADIDKVGVLEEVIREASRREDIELEEVDRLLRAFVHYSLRDLGATYNELFSLFWDDPDTARREYLNYGLEYVRDQVNEVEKKPDWPWPITEPPESKGGPFDRSIFKNK